MNQNHKHVVKTKRVGLRARGTKQWRYYNNFSRNYRPMLHFHSYKKSLSKHNIFNNSRKKLKARQ